MPEPLIYGLHHLQLAIPAGREHEARVFYRDVLGLMEVPVPSNVAHLAAAWFEAGSLLLHLGIDHAFHPAKKAHPAFLVRDLPALQARLEAAGTALISADHLPGFRRCHVLDPFGNRLELIEPLATER